MCIRDRDNFDGAKPYDSIDGGWVTPYVMDPANGNKLWAGYQEVYATTDGAFTWTQISNNLTGGQNLQNLVVSASNNNFIYASRNENLYVTTDGGANWTTYNAAPGQYISYITLDPGNSSKLWLTVTSNGSDKVLYSKNAGSTFTNITGNLTNMGFNCIAFQKNANNALYVGTETGIFFKDSTMTNWIAYNTDLPSVGVRELEINYTIGKIRAATYGRGIWEAPLYNHVGIAENDISNDFTIYPNPAKNQINIDVNGKKEGNISITLFNIVGSVVKNTETMQPSKTIKLDVSHLVSGTYFVKISSKKGNCIKKIIVMN
jgi:hypothetical protein